MSERPSAVVTILFTDLVGSTELLSRAGDEEAQRIFRVHHDLLAETAAAHGGEEVKWLGDGLMVAFPSAADAVNCAIAMQQAGSRPIHGEQLAIRAGLNAGEALRDAADYFGLPVVVARRLCDRAEAGQILCTEVVAGLLSGRLGFAFDPLGGLELKGVSGEVGCYAVHYEVRAARGVPTRMPFVGRDTVLASLEESLTTTSAGGRGGLVMITGEPGVGKTRLAEELTEHARRAGWQVLWGRCLEGDWAPPYAAFAEAIEAHVLAHPGELRVDLGPGVAAVAQLVPRVRDVLPDVPVPAALQSDAERFRLLDSVARFLAARALRAPVLVCIDDLQWADRGSMAMFRHVARAAPHHRLLAVGIYRDTEVDDSHPLTDTLRALRREVEYRDLKLEGLSVAETTELLAALADHEVAERVGAEWARETEGNPFFIRELLRHLIEVGKLFPGPDGRWDTERPLRELGIPPGVRDVVARRLGRLSDNARQLLAVASAFEGAFGFELAARVAGLSEDVALDALDEILAAQILQPAAAPDTYAFTNTPIRQTTYGELSPSRRVRLHRRIAEAIEALFPEPTPAQAGEVAAQYLRSAGLAGSERGVAFALAAATHAETTGAHDDAVRFLRAALELIPEGDERRPRLLGRLGVALAWADTFDEAVQVVSEAGRAVAVVEGEAAATDYLSELIASCLENVDRLAAVEGIGLLDTPSRPELDRLTSEAARRLGAPMALMSILDDRRQFWASFYGLEKEFPEQAERRQAPVEASYCKHVVAFDEPFRVHNAPTHALLRHHPGASRVRSYLGVPLRTKSGQNLGSFCVGDTSPRAWTPDDQRVLEELAAEAMAVAEPEESPYSG